MANDIDLYRGGQDLTRQRQELQFREQYGAYQRREWEAKGEHQKKMMQLANDFEDARQQLLATRQYGPKLHAVQMKTRIAEAELKLKGKKAMIRNLEGGSKPSLKGGNDIILQLLIERRAALEAEGMDTGPIDELIERHK